MQAWANFLGIMAAILASIQYLPQIHTTWRLRCVGSLSIPMMCLQTPGGYVWAASLAARLGKEGWSTWGVYIVTASLQGIVLAMAIYFEYINPKEKKTHHHGEGAAANGTAEFPDEHATDVDGQPTEETPLLQSQ